MKRLLLPSRPPHLPTTIVADLFASALLTADILSLDAALACKLAL